MTAFAAAAEPSESSMARRIVKIWATPDAGSPSLRLARPMRIAAMKENAMIAACGGRLAAHTLLHEWCRLVRNF